MTGTTFTSNNITKRAFETLIDRIADYPEYIEEKNFADLHNELYNMDYEYIYTSDAVKDLEEYGTFKAIGKIKDYEQFNFGEVNTDFSNPCDVANMLFYIIGEEIIYNVVEPIVDEWDEISEENETILFETIRNEYKELAA